MAKNNYLRTSSLDIYESITYKNIRQRNTYNKLLLGEALRIDVGQENVSSSTGQVNLTARPPSWTQHHAGLNHSFVVQTISSSNHEAQILNAFKSGTVPYEISPVPYSGSQYYTKSRSLVKYTASVTASAAIGEAFDAVSGSRLAASQPSAPTIIDIPVNQYGKIVDIKVWIELISISGSTDTNPFGPLSRIGVAIKSPNVKFNRSKPILNDPTIIKSDYDDYYFWKNSYLLWVGSQLDDFLFSVSGPPYQSAEDYHTWNKDRHMRTVFCDDANETSGYNPRNLASSHGDFFGLSIGAAASTTYAGNSPNGAKIDGNDFPWMTDARIQDGGPYGAVGSPPAGWLTGPGGVTGSNEWPTTGSNLGPARMLPIYPLLDTVLEQKCAESIHREKFYDYGPAAATSAGKDTLINLRKGTRPGLRGTEAYGTWQLLIVTHDNYATVGVGKTWFRQVRLEFTLEQGKPISNILPRKKGVQSGKKIKPYAILSGSKFGVNWGGGSYGAATDKFRNIVYKIPEIDYHTSVGIVDNTGTINGTDFAVFSRITGALADTYSSSSRAHARYMFLNNEFGTPYIPLSSGSGEAMSSQVFLLETTENTKQITNEVLDPKLSIKKIQTLSTTLSTTKPAILTRDKAKTVVTTYFTNATTTTSGSS